jgi:hypothetical protein
MKPDLPKGYRWLRVGMNRPEGYRYFDNGVWCDGHHSLWGSKISVVDVAGGDEPYIAPVRKGRKRK